jgi:hypothetical protein
MKEYFSKGHKVNSIRLIDQIDCAYGDIGWVYGGESGYWILDAGYWPAYRR